MWKTFLLASRQGDQIGRIFSNSLGDYLRWAVFENCNSRLMNVLLFVQAESYRNLLPQTLHWAKIWAISSQTRLVTLLAVYVKANHKIICRMWDSLASIQK
jgi:hypothetical protein